MPSSEVAFGYCSLPGPFLEILVVSAHTMHDGSRMQECIPGVQSTAHVVSFLPDLVLQKPQFSVGWSAVGIWTVLLPLLGGTGSLAPAC